MGCVLTWIESHQGLAAWMQAIFSVIAIYAAFKIGGNQAAHAKHLEDERYRLDEIQRIMIVSAVLVQARIIVQQLSPRLLDFRLENTPLSTNLLRDCKASLLSLPLFEIPAPDIVLNISVIPRAIEELCELIDFAQNIDNPFDKRSSAKLKIPQHCVVLNDATNSAIESCNDALKRRKVKNATMDSPRAT